MCVSPSFGVYVPGARPPNSRTRMPVRGGGDGILVVVFGIDLVM